MTSSTWGSALVVLLALVAPTTSVAGCSAPAAPVQSARTDCPPAPPAPPTSASNDDAGTPGPRAPSDAGLAPKQTPHDVFTLSSTVLGEARKVHLYRPPSSAGPLSVLYLLDGGDDEDFPHPGMMAAIDLAIRHDEMRPMAVVGIENTERRRDMTGPTQVEKDRSIAPRVGGSDAFRSFIKNELMPEIKKRLGPTGKIGIAGESLAGLFVMETFFLEPKLFDAYVAISPSLWWNGGALSRAAEGWMKSHPNIEATLYVGRAGDDDIGDAVATLGGALRSSAPKKLTWFFEPRADLKHSNIYEAIAPVVIRKLWPPLSK